MSKIKVMSFFGTRPEAIKMVPVVKALEACPEIESVVCLSGQHREMLRQVLNAFEVRADFDLDIMKPRQTITTITSKTPTPHHFQNSITTITSKSSSSSQTDMLPH